MPLHQNKNNIDYTLYLVTDPDLVGTTPLEEAVAEAIAGGCPVVQLRDKNADSRVLYQTAKTLRVLTREKGVLFLINDRLDIAMAVGADGVHLGQKDLPCSVARKLLGEDAVIGVSAATVEEAKQAEADGADYLGVGAVFATSTKQNTRPMPIPLLKEIKAAVSIPVIAIGGITAENVTKLLPANVDGIAVVSAILAQKDRQQAATKLRELFVQGGADHFCP